MSTKVTSILLFGVAIPLNLMRNFDELTYPAGRVHPLVYTHGREDTCAHFLGFAFTKSSARWDVLGFPNPHEDLAWRPELVKAWARVTDKDLMPDPQWWLITEFI